MEGRVKAKALAWVAVVAILTVPFVYGTVRDGEEA